MRYSMAKRSQMTKRYIKIIPLTLLVMLCTAFIFSNSLKNIEESRADSDVIVEVVEEICDKIAPDNDLNFDYIVRKGAHLTEFFLLGALTTMHYIQVGKRRKCSVAFVFLYVIAVAFTDEFIQRFTGRGSSITDVVIDVCGAFIGISAVLLVALMVKKHLNKKRSC